MIGLNKKTYRKKNSFMNDFTKNMAQALFNQDIIFVDVILLLIDHDQFHDY